MQPSEAACGDCPDLKYLPNVLGRGLGARVCLRTVGRLTPGNMDHCPAGRLSRTPAQEVDA